MTSTAELIAEATRLSELIDKGVAAMTQAGHDYANAEHAYRIGKAKAWAKAPAGTVPERTAWVDAETADLRRERDIAEALRTSAWEALRSRRAQLSSVQTVANALRSEMDMAKYGPQEAA